MGFIGFVVKRERGADGDVDPVVRIFLECRDGSPERRDAAELANDPQPGTSYTYAVDVIFPGGKSPCRLRGVDRVLVLKKFYKLVNSLEERAREHGNPREKALESVETMVEHLGYTRNARDFTGLPEPSRTGAKEIHRFRQ